MNQSSAQTPQQAQGQPATAGTQARPPMYQPNQIRGLPMLSEEEKTKYEQGLRGLWNKVNTSTSNSPEQLAARHKIIEFSRMLISKIQTRRNQAAQQQVRQQGGQSSAPSRPASASQQTPGAPQPAAPGQQQQQQPEQQQKQPQQSVAGNAASLQGDTAVLSVAASQLQSAQGAAMATSRAKVPDAYIQRANEVNWQLLVQHNNKTAAELTRMREEMREKYARCVWRKDMMQKQMASMEIAADKHISERKENGNPISDEESKQFHSRRELQNRGISESQKYIDSVRRQQETLQIGAQQQQLGSAGLGAQQQTDPQQSQTAGTNATQKLASGVNQGLAIAPHAGPAADAARKQHLNRASPAITTPVSSAQPLPQNQARAVNPQSQMPLQQHQGHSTEQAHASPVNTGFPAMAQKQGQVHSPAPGQAARVQTPQAAPPGPARTLSHSAAMSLANQRATNTPGGASLPNQQSTVVTHSPAGGPAHQQGHPHAHPTQQQQQPLPPSQQHQQQVQQSQQQPPQPPPQPQSQPQSQSQSQTQPPAQTLPQTQAQSQAQTQAQATSQAQIQPQPSSQTQSQQSMVSKMPIPKTLPEKATTIPQGVSVGGGVNPGRPSMTQGSGTLGGVMNQPAVSRVPAYNHDAEGDHVLSKKKLDELVRQVCGGSAEGHEGSLLAPEVEENILNMADMFVDGVLQDACRNAKERGSKVLEIRDIQMVLERTYNIRVPGYSSDELRTVRRVQPAAGWIAKMSAVQAAKVMPGKGDL
ncbi:hypothetical protein CDD81_1299 [Ophiocordyceps australis]|uniref:Transcription initiation factor TFIID subunit 12 domain-containing protein n=1 Tax=Ophiocordyceps australis TaxID=1399860 RepID=A0A2C5Y1K5_9HYPO|nr:hypothetical protein CDD81_1299 [Ophiocordyceps australis]